MKPIQTYSFVSATVLTLAAAALVIKSDPAIAEEASEAMEEVVVEAPIAVRQVGRTNINARIEVIELKRRISYADLDLSKHADVLELESRVETISKESCEKLYDMFPPDSVTDTRRCIENAVSSAEEQIQAAIVAAN